MPKPFFIRGVRVRKKRSLGPVLKWRMAHDIVEGKPIKAVAIDHNLSYSSAHKIFLFHIHVEQVMSVVGLTHPDQLDLPF